MGEVFYVTTPIYYVNDLPHIGTAYTTLAADVVARYQRLKGKEVFFLTGTDEHGQKVAQAAAERHLDPQKWVDEMVPHFIDTWKLLNISNDDFIRTTENRHTEVAQKFIEKLRKNGDIYLGTYEGWYCVSEESFVLPSSLVGGKCPDCGRPVEWVKEDNYFFRLSKYSDALLAHIEENPDFIEPESRKNEVVNFIKSGLSDQSISRTSFTWGIPLPQEPQHVIYVWFDALLNYISAIDYGRNPERFERIWPADLHLVGKEILRFHAITWPAMLMAADLPLPKKIFAHGWLTVEGQKMSKSLGNVIKPAELVEEFGVDAYRYYFMREFSFGVDGDFSRKGMLNRYNSDLANDLGNLESRILAMVDKYRQGVVPEPSILGAEENTLVSKAAETAAQINHAMENLSFNGALREIWDIVHALNRYVDVSAPWSIAKDLSRGTELDTILYTSLEGLRLVATYIKPFMPETSEKMLEHLGLDEKKSKLILPHAAEWGVLPTGLHTRKGDPLFPRIQGEVLESN